MSYQKKKKVYYFDIQQTKHVKYIEHQDRIIISQTFKASFSMNTSLENLKVSRAVD